MNLIKQVLKANPSVEVIKMLVELQQKKEFTKAMIAFRSECPEIEKSTKGELPKTGQEYMYAKIEEVQRVINPVAARNGLTYKFNQKFRENQVTVQCVVTHVSGYSETTIMSSYREQSEDLSQEQQTAVTTSYLKRYTLWNAFGLTLKDMDEDAVKAPEKITGGIKGLVEAVARTEKKQEPHNHDHYVAVKSPHKPSEMMAVPASEAHKYERPNPRVGIKEAERRKAESKQEILKDEELDKAIEELEEAWTKPGEVMEIKFAYDYEDGAIERVSKAIQEFGQQVTIQSLELIIGWASMVVAGSDIEEIAREYFDGLANDELMIEKIEPCDD